MELGTTIRRGLEEIVRAAGIPLFLCWCVCLVVRIGNEFRGRHVVRAGADEFHRASELAADPDDDSGTVCAAVWRSADRSRWIAVTWG